MQRIGLGACGMLLLSLPLVGLWASWREPSRFYAWSLDDPERIIAHFSPQEKLTVSFQLLNAARVPLRIVGASIC